MSRSENFSETSHPQGVYDSTLSRVKYLLTEEPNVENMTQLLTDWQMSRLSVTESDSGVLCLLRMWFSFDDSYIENELYCSTAWDNLYCWPPTLAGTTTRRLCSEVLYNASPLLAEHLEGYATRNCLKNGTWLRGFRTNYSECAKALLTPDKYEVNDERLSTFVHYMVFIGSLASLLCLGTALTMLCSFRNVWNERIKIHVHLMSSLVLRFVVFMVISEAFVLNRSSSYRDNNILCLAILIIHLYSTLSSTSWMLVQGIYLNGKLTTNVFGFRSRRGFQKFYVLGWVLPSVLLGIYAGAMLASQNFESCWEGYAGMKEIWILIVPMKVEMLINGILLCNILRVVLKKRRVTNDDMQFTQIKSIAKITLWLFPILGLNNLLFLYNPGGQYETLFISLNISLGSTQGIPVAIVYCLNCTEVHQAIRRSYHRFVVRRNVVNVTLYNTAHVGMVIFRAPEPDKENGNENIVGDDAISCV